MEKILAWPMVHGTAQGESTVRFRSGLSVFFPAYDDAMSLETLLPRTFETLRRVAEDFEVIVVNDGSTDATAEVLEKMRVRYAPHLRIVTHPVNLGYGAALRSGFAAATKEFIFYTDGDGQYDPAQLEDLLQAVTPEVALVNGYKIERHDPWHRIIIGKTYNQVARAIFGIQLRDIDCDFRVIRRSALEHSHLRSTGGTICIELVRSLEATDQKVVEVPVHHYPRLHGSSRFFRVRSLLTTFLQLCQIYFRLVLLPFFSGSQPPRRMEPLPSRGTACAVMLAVAALSFLTYFKALQLPFISDSYDQLQRAREFGPVSGWAGLAGDVLYRWRATSLVLTYWTDRLAGPTPWIFHVVGILVHILCGFLVYCLGAWRPIGWRVAGAAACYFAVSQRHSEAVIWHAALPELMVFFFSVASFLCWIHWLQASRNRHLAYGGALVCFLLALLSKESAVALVPLCGLAALLQGRTIQGRTIRKNLLAGLPFLFGALGYFILTYLSRDGHQHFSDGTFSLSAPFIPVLFRSFAGLLRTWGFISILTLLCTRHRELRSAAKISLLWMVFTLLPYCYLLYMPRVPSRHTYFASAGLALLVGAGALALRDSLQTSKYRWATPVLGLVLIAHQTGYMWTYKHYQYAMRAEPTERLIRTAQQSEGPVYASCFPYAASIAEQALKVRLPHREISFIRATDAESAANAVDFCNPVAHEGGR